MSIPRWGRPDPPWRPRRVPAWLTRFLDAITPTRFEIRFRFRRKPRP